GIDAAHKLTMMASIAFGMPMQFDQAYTEGITQLTTKDIKYAEELGYRVKLLGITKNTEAGVELRVHPTLIPEKRLIANVNGAMNAVVVKGDAVGPTLYYGAGAGAEPTASAVVADLVDIARLSSASKEQRVPYLGFQLSQQVALKVLPISEVSSAYYLRMRVLDKPGVLADVTKILGDRQISIDAMMQKEPQENESEADIVILTHVTVEKNMDAAIAAIEALSAIDGKVTKIRMEELSR
ncbi:MAG: homoserine dehydrogenase, partial [Methylophilales bacterium 28-44-11]